MKNFCNYLLGGLLLMGSTCLQGQTAPERSGFSGYVQMTAGPIHFRSNTVASLLRIEVSNKQTESLQTEPTLQKQISPQGTYEFTYSFADLKSQIFFGSSIQDIVRLDLVQQLAFRRFLDNGGYVSAGFLLSTLPINVYEDPFEVDEDRVVTQRRSTGFRLELSKIGKSDFGLQYDYRIMRLNEKSGESLNLPEEDMVLLDRNGTNHRIALNYTKKLSDHHYFAPSFRYTYDNRDGEARRAHVYGLELSHLFRKERLSTVATVFGAIRSFAGENPIFGETQQNQGPGFRGAVYYRINKNTHREWLANISFVYAESRSNIDFYYASAMLIQGGFMFRFSPQKDN